jgi:hypothetical protein
VPKIGLCALCRQEGQELQASHFLPAGVYRVLRDESQDNPDPIKFNDHGVFQDSKQVKDYLLCHSCEQRLSKNGENWFLAHCCRKEQFRLASLMDEVDPVAGSDSIKVYLAEQVSKINVAALTYFAASMFWRASVHQWTIAGEENRRISLGPYEEHLRAFLMEDAPFPRNCVLWVSVPETITPFSQLSLTPYGERKDGYHQYKLIMLGLGFHLLIGGKIPDVARAMCFVTGAGNPIYRTDMLEKGVMRDIHRKFDRNPQLLAGPK